MKNYQSMRWSSLAAKLMAIAILLTCASLVEQAQAFQRLPTPLRRTHPHSSPLVTPKQPCVGRRTAVRPLEAAPLVAAALPLASVAILAFIVLVHESGHYLAARSFGIRVEEFSIGVGPKLLGFKAFGDEFNLRALPLGGYVRFPENYNATRAREEERKAIAAADAFDKAQEKDVGTEIINALTLGSIDDRRRKQAKEQRAREMEELGKLPWWKKIGKKPSIPEVLDIDDVQIEYYDDPDLLQNRPWFQRAVVLSAGVIFNLILAFSIYLGQINYGTGLPRPIFNTGALISSAPRPDAAAYGLLDKGDVVLSVNGKLVTFTKSPTATESQKGINSFISTIRSTPDGEALSLTVVHPDSGKPVQVNVTPKRSGTKGPATIGVLLTPNFVKSEILKSSSIVEGAKLAAEYVATQTKETAAGLATALIEIATNKGSSAGSQVSGPIGLIKTGSDVVSTQDLTTILLFAAAISINLGVVNAFPLPALDGGQLLFVLSEALTGRKVDQRVQEGITGAALLFLLLASAGAAIGDIESIFSL